VGLLLLGLLLDVALTTAAAPASNVVYRRIDVQDPATGELFPVALWYPTRAAPAPLLLTGSLSACRLQKSRPFLLRHKFPLGAEDRGR
jgi:hypothetical protein